MNRFRFYVYIFLANLAISIVALLFKFSDFAGVINFGSFLAVIIYFLFSWEEPPKVSKLAIPEVHTYYKSRINNYNNIIAVEFGIVSFIFFILLYSTNLSVGFVTMVLWAVTIPVTYFVMYLNQRTQNKSKLLSYMHFIKPDIDSIVLEKILNEFINLKTLNKSSLGAIKDVDPTLLNELFEIYLNYLASADNDLTKEEIEAINSL